VRAACEKIGVDRQEVEQGLPESSRQATAAPTAGAFAVIGLGVAVIAAVSLVVAAATT